MQIQNHRLVSCYLYLSLLINDKLMFDSTKLKIWLYLKFYLRELLYSKVVYKSGRTAWVWTNYAGVLSQDRSEIEAFYSLPVPMAWIWSYYRPYLEGISNNSVEMTGYQSFQSNISQKVNVKNQKKSSLCESKKPSDRLALVLLGAIVAIVLI